MPKASKGFTLIELMIVIGVLAILTATAIPAFGSFNQRKRFKSSVDTFVNDLESMRNKSQSAIVHSTAIPSQVDWAIQYNCGLSTYNLGHGTNGSNFVSDMQKKLDSGTFEACAGSQTIYFQRISGEVYGLDESSSKIVRITMSSDYSYDVVTYKSGQTVLKEIITSEGSGGGSGGQGGWGGENN